MVDGAGWIGDFDVTSELPECKKIQQLSLYYSLNMSQFFPVDVEFMDGLIAFDKSTRQ